MSIVDLTSMGEPQSQLKKEINDRLTKLKNEISDYCFQCAKCTSGCEAHKLLELEPHKMAALLKRGLIDEMVNSDIIWTCMKNLAVASGKQIPGKYTAFLQSILSIGGIQDIQEITTRDNKTKRRSDLGLPNASKPKDLTKFQACLMKIAVEKV